MSLGGVSRGGDVSAGFRLSPSYQGRQDVSVFAWLMAAMAIPAMEETCRG
jgi:hypothetical protein